MSCWAWLALVSSGAVDYILESQQPEKADMVSNRSKDAIDLEDIVM